MSKRSIAAIAVAMIVGIVLVISLDLPVFWGSVGTLVLALIAVVVVESVHSSFEDKKNKKHEKYMQFDHSFDTDKNLQAIMKERAAKDKLIKAGAVILCCDKSPQIAITNHGGVSSSQFIHPSNLHPEILTDTYDASFTTTGKASVTGRAVAGGILAGGAGAVVGAISAQEANKKGGVVHNHERTRYMSKLSINGTVYSSFCIAKSVCDRFGVPEYDMNGFTIEEADNYFEVSGPFSDGKTAPQKDGIQYYCNYLSRVISGIVMNPSYSDPEVKKLVAEKDLEEKAMKKIADSSFKQVFDVQTERIEIPGNAPPFKTWVFTPVGVKIGKAYIPKENINSCWIKEGYGLKNGVMQITLKSGKTYTCGFSHQYNLTMKKIRAMKY